ncbi:MAG: Tricarboxylate transport protein TctC [Betaproteobacteria bacterium]|nr:Tricarboxylate transport protein TctC [Betaproteobacteria bacterium]
MNPAIKIAMSTLAILAFAAGAADFPTKPVRLIVPYPPGGGNDAISRLLAPKFTESTGQQLIIDNRPGAGTTIGTALAARAAGDGYTIVMSSVATHAMAPQLYSNPGYDPIKDFTAVTLLATTPMILTVSASLPYKTVQDIIAATKASPGKLSYASGGNGTPPHLAAAVFTEKTGIQMVHVPYKGSGPALIDVMSGQIAMIIDTAASVTPHIRGGKLRGIAITGKRRWPDLPDVPTFSEGGLPDYDASSWYAIHAPAGTPKEIVAKLNAELARIVKLPDVSERLRLMSAEAVGGTPAELDAFVRSEASKWGKVIKSLNLRVD